MEKKNQIYEPDSVDLDIIRELQKDSRQSIREIASKVHRSATPVFERVRRLESHGIIRRYTLDLDMEKIGKGFTVFCNVSLRHISTDIHEDFAAEMLKIPEVTECYNVSGDYDYMLKVQTPDMKSYRKFVTDCLGRIPVLDSVHSVFVMESIKDTPPVL
ncbi:MAG: Lrp/AsnC family transcriptional regulator [Muribaculaceae bacterium]|nr:Lrp/AsnC family transcriptional regulator [Muribaculaceae bacterium]